MLAVAAAEWLIFRGAHKSRNKKPRRSEGVESRKEPVDPAVHQPSQPQSGYISIPKTSNFAAVEFHQQQFVDLQGHPFPLALADHLGGELRLVEF